MRLKGKKPIFSYKDTWSMDATLSPIIAAGLQKFVDVCRERHKTDKTIGIPSAFLSDEYPSFTANHDVTDEMVEAWFDCVDEMIYAFANDGPSIGDYDFEFIYESGEPDQRGMIPYTITTRNESEYQRYREDQEAHEERRRKGLELLGKYYDCLWW